MYNLERLSRLINSLSKSEKRYFRLACALQNGDKKYLYLYEWLEKGTDIEEVSKTFCHEFGKRSLEIAEKYLYEQLLDCLVHLDRKMNVQGEILHLISQSAILEKRCYIRDAMKKLSKAEQLAIDFEQDILLLLILRTEIIYIMENNYIEFSERELISKHTRLNELMKITRNKNIHISLYSTLNYRLDNFNEVRSDKQKSSMNDLILSELNLMSYKYYQSFESMKIHLLFQASYYLHTGSYKSAIRYYTELLNLFEQSEYLKENPPTYYLLTIKGIANSLLTAGIYKEIPIIIDKMKNLEERDYPEEFLLKVRSILFFTETEYYIYSSQFSKTLELCISYEEVLLKKTKSLNPEDRLQINISMSIIYLYNKQPKMSRRYMKRIMQEGKLLCVFPLFRTARLLNLIIAIELNDYELLENEVRSIKRSIRGESHTYMTEALVLKFVIQYPMSKYKKINSFSEKMKKEITAIHQNKYERQILKVFDFCKWIENKLT